MESLDKSEREEKRDENTPQQGQVRSPQTNIRGSEGILTGYNKIFKPGQNQP